MKNRVLIGLVLILALSSCATIQDGKYLGGILHVEGFSKPKQDVSDSASEQTAGDPVAQEEVTVPPKRDLSAQANAQGVCWIGCKSKEPAPMEKVEFSIAGVDVDTAYTRIKRDFDFKTRAERIEANPNVEGWLENTLDFRYQATPSVNYLMRGYREHKYLKEETPNTIQVEVFKDGASKVFIKVSFYSGNTKDLEGYKSSLKKRIIETVKG